MTLKRLTALIVTVELIALGIFFAFILGATATMGGTVTLDMTQYGERWVEYWIMLILVAITPYGLYAAEEMFGKNK